ncbi:MAG: VanZ family protein [Oscillospiraceae bacterium]|nr:VanZ family protein [Oscillospiraceae bacterium]
MAELYNKPSKLAMFFIILFRIIFTAAVFLTIAFIFYNSSQIGEVSSEYSTYFTAIINKLLTYTPFDIVLTEHHVRKLAHVAEFAVLGFFLTFCLRVYTRRLIAFCAWPLLFGLFIAVCDEFYQRFIPGRAGSIKDIFIDFIGVCGGTGVAICIVFVLSFIFWLFWGRKRNKRRKEAFEKEKAEIDRARAFLAQQDKIKAEQAEEAARIEKLVNSDAAKILAENSAEK